MHSFELSRNRRVNVWLDEAPPACFEASSVQSRIVKPKEIINPQRRIAAIEFNIPYGPKASYGLLGAELVKAEVDGLEVVVSINPEGSPLIPSLALMPDEVKIGMTEEYAGAVIIGIERVTNSIGLPANLSLRFRWAAYGRVGSSPLAFEKVSGFLVQLLALPEDASEKEIITIFE
jgi:hypothetical protein